MYMEQRQRYKEFEEKVSEFLKKAEAHKLEPGWHFAVIAMPKKMRLTKIEGIPETFIQMEDSTFKLMRKYWNRQKNIELNWYEPVQKAKL